MNKQSKTTPQKVQTEEEKTDSEKTPTMKIELSELLKDVSEDGRSTRSDLVAKMIQKKKTKPNVDRLVPS